MKKSKGWSLLRVLFMIACVLVLRVGAARGAGPQNEVGAFLVFPDISVEALPGGGGTVETLFSVTNASPNSYFIHVNYFNGDETDPSYCYDCDFTAPLGAMATNAYTIGNGDFGVVILSLDGGLEVSCPFTRGFVTVALEDASGNTLSDNVLYGDQVVIDYAGGRTHSVAALPFQGMLNDGDKDYDFDDVEYGKMPRVVATEFIAPNGISQTPTDFDAYLTLFTLNFSTQLPPSVACEVTGIDAAGNLFAASLSFGCWTRIELEDIDPTFAYPNLGVSGSDEHGWLQLNCSIDVDSDGTSDANGGVHGAVFQVEPAGTIWGGSGSVADPTAWSRVLVQSITTGDPVTLDLDFGSAPAPAKARRGLR